MNIYDPNHYKHFNDDSAMIQAAVDAAKESGEKVIIPRHNERTGKNIWVINKTVNLYTGSVICLDNCHMRLADGMVGNMFKNSNGRDEAAKSISGRQYDIHIYGIGNAILDGGNHNGLIETNAAEKGLPMILNTMIHFHNAERIIVEDITIISQRWWGMTFHYCSDVRISNIRYRTLCTAPNCDGIDLRTGCNGFIIENISGYTQDDTVALTNLACKTDDVMCVKGMDDSIHNVVIRNITAKTTCASVRLLNHARKKLYNIIIENIQQYCEFDPADVTTKATENRIPFSENYYYGSTATDAQEDKYWQVFGKNMSVALRIGENTYFGDNIENRAKPGEMYNIVVRNIQAQGAYAVGIAATLTDSTIENVRLYGEGISPIHFGPGEFRNITFRDIGYSEAFKIRENSYPNQFVEDPNYGYDEIAAVYFNGSKARDLRFDGIYVPKYAESVFSGRNCDVQLNACNINKGAEVKLVDSDGINANISE